MIRSARGAGCRQQQSGGVRLDVPSGTACGRPGCQLSATERHCSRHELVRLCQVVPQTILFTHQTNTAHPHVHATTTNQSLKHHGNENFGNQFCNDNNTRLTAFFQDNLGKVVRSFALFGATMEAVAGMLIHSTALRPITTRPSAHLQCLCSICRCCVATVVMTACL